MKHLLFLLTFCSCTPPAKPATVSPADANAFLAAIAHDEASRHSLSGEGSVTLSQNGVPLKGELTLAVSDERVRLDVAADSGQTLFTLVSDGTTVTLLDFKNRTASQGPAATTALAAAGLQGFTAPALALLLLARLPCTEPRAVERSGVIHLRQCLGAELEATYTPRRDAPGFFLSELSLQTGTDTSRARLFGHTSAGFARRIELQTPGGRAVVTLTELDANPTVSEALFQLHIPPGLRLTK